ncbi:Uncharacterized protein Rs2_40309 [Raphanus sativus]|nr:Uncharacterized protein Rs2_40309 [Raphanus sativus]
MRLIGKQEEKLLTFVSASETLTQHLKSGNQNMKENMERWRKEISSNQSVWSLKSALWKKNKRVTSYGIRNEPTRYTIWQRIGSQPVEGIRAFGCKRSQISIAAAVIYIKTLL